MLIKDGISDGKKCEMDKWTRYYYLNDKKSSKLFLLNSNNYSLQIKSFRN